LPAVNIGGVYITEHILTGLYPYHGGGLDVKTTTLNYIIDILHDFMTRVKNITEPLRPLSAQILRVDCL
jgi:hypothetical protein